jgi:hypothetical protein
MNITLWVLQVLLAGLPGTWLVLSLPVSGNVGADVIDRYRSPLSRMKTEGSSSAGALQLIYGRGVTVTLVNLALAAADPLWLVTASPT